MVSDIQGYCEPQFKQTREVLKHSLESGDDLGASFAVTIDGKPVVDIWGGYLDDDKTRPWQENTIVNVYSTTKTMAFLCALILADRGQLDFDADVSTYWPEFAAAGKEHVKVWHVMDHAAGLSGLEARISEADLYDWDKITGLLAAQAPWWEPGSATGYHAITQGYLIGEIVRRISGQSIGQFFQDEIAAPMSADFFIGVPASEFSRIGDLVPPSDGDTLAASQTPDSIAARTFGNPAVSALESRTKGWRTAEIPAANGHGNARSVAKIHSALACGGTAFGARLFGADTAASVTRERISGVDQVLGTPVRFGLGFGINSATMPLSPNANTVFWGGWGGSLAIIDQDARMSVAFVMNKMGEGTLGDMRAANLLQATYEALMA